MTATVTVCALLQMSAPTANVYPKVGKIAIVLTSFIRGLRFPFPIQAVTVTVTVCVDQRKNAKRGSVFTSVSSTVFQVKANSW